MVTVFNEREQTTTKVNSNSVQELLQHLNINPETVLVVREGEVITEKVQLQPTDKVEILSVISGG